MGLDSPIAGKRILDQNSLILIFIAYLKLQLQKDLEKAKRDPQYIPQYRQKDVEEIIAQIRIGICSGFTAFLGHKLLRGKFQEMLDNIEPLKAFGKVGFNQDLTFKDNGAFLINQGKKPGVPEGEELNRKYNPMVALIEDVLSNMRWLQGEHKIPFRDIWDEYELTPSENNELIAILSKERIEAKSLLAFCQKTFPMEDEVLESIFNKERMEKLKSIFLKSKEKAALRYLDQLLDGALEKSRKKGKEVRTTATQIDWDKLINFLSGEETPKLQHPFSLHAIFKKEEVGEIIQQITSSLESTKIISLEVPYHAVLVYKEGDNYYFSDPNNGRLLGPYTKSDELTSIVLTLYPKNTTHFEFGIDVFSDPIKSKLDKSLDVAKIMTELLKKREEMGGDNLVNLREDDGPTSLHLAAQSGHLELVKVLLQAKADTMAKDEKENTALHIAAYLGHIGIVEVLLKEKVDITVTNKEGNTPLHLAIQNGHLSVVETLIKAGASINAANSNRNTPLHLAAWNGNSDVVKALLNEKANVMAKDATGSTALHWAVKAGHVHVVEALINAQANINAANTNGNTPLHFAAQLGDIKVVDTLLKALFNAKASIPTTNKYGNTPLHMAAQAGHVRVVEALLNAGADFMVKDKKGNTPLQLAIKNGHEGVKKALLDAQALRSVKAGYPAMRFSEEVDKSPSSPEASDKFPPSSSPPIKKKP